MTTTDYNPSMKVRSSTSNRLMGKFGLMSAILFADTTCRIIKYRDSLDTKTYPKLHSILTKNLRCMKTEKKKKKNDGDANLRRRNLKA